MSTQPPTSSNISLAPAVTASAATAGKPGATATVNVTVAQPPVPAPAPPATAAQPAATTGQGGVTPVPLPAPASANPPPVPSTPVKKSSLPWIIGGIAAAILLLIGAVAWMNHSAKGDRLADKAELNRQLDLIREAQQKPTGLAPANPELEKQLADQKAQADAEAQKAKEQAEAALKERDQLIKDQQSTMEKISAQLAAQKAQADAEAQKAQANAEAAAAKIADKDAHFFGIDDEEALKARILGFDEKQVAGYRIPLFKNNTGKPTPFHPDGTPPVFMSPGANWVVIDNYMLSNGQKVKAWAVKLGATKTARR